MEAMLGKENPRRLPAKSSSNLYHVVAAMNKQGIETTTILGWGQNEKVFNNLKKEPCALRSADKENALKVKVRQPVLPVVT